MFSPCVLLSLLMRKWVEKDEIFNYQEGQKVYKRL